MQTRSPALLSVALVASLALTIDNAVSAQCPLLASETQSSSSAESTRKTNAEGVIHTTEANFKRDVLEARQPVLVDFYATWCGPCRMLSPIVESTSKLYSGKVTFYKVDVDKSPGLAARYGVVSIPTIKIFKNGKLADSSSGFLTESELKEMVQKQL